MSGVFKFAANHVVQPERSIPVLAEADVIVAGGSPTGVAAAVAAARTGARTILVERFSFLGGQTSAGLMITFHRPFWDAYGNRVVAGLPVEILQRAIQYGGTQDTLDMLMEEGAHYWKAGRSVYRHGKPEYHSRTTRSHAKRQKPEVGIMNMQLTGYRRENGKVGIRNYVLVIPIDDISNAAAEGVASLIRGTYSLSHPYGRLQFGEDLNLTMNTLIGTGANANIAGVVVIGIEAKWTDWVAQGIARTGKPVEAFSIERYGDLKTIELASRSAMKIVQYANELQRGPIEMGELTVSAKCGESDTTLGLASNPAIGRVFERMLAVGATAIFGETSEVTGAEDKIADRCVNDRVKAAFLKTFQDYQDFIIGTGADLLGSQPTQGNIRGGLSTIEEKALGNVEKIGNCPVTSVLKPAEAPLGPGLHFMDSSSAAAEMVTLCAAGGSVLHFFTTGQGNIIGNPIIPVMKISANPLTISTMPEHIDVDLSAMLRLEMTLNQAADAIMDVMGHTINGRLTAAEALRHEEFVITKLYRSA